MAKVCHFGKLCLHIFPAGGRFIFPTQKTRVFCVPKPDTESLPKLWSKNPEKCRKMPNFSTKSPEKCQFPPKKMQNKANLQTDKMNVSSATASFYE
jgi:hypothetical protein